MIDAAREAIDGPLRDPKDPKSARAGGLQRKVDLLGQDAEQTLLDRLRSRNTQIAAYEDGITKVNAMDRRLGWIFASSGLDRFGPGPKKLMPASKGGHVTGPPTDWALIQIPDMARILTPNPVPKSDEWTNLGFQPVRDSVKFAVRTEFQAGETVFQRGRNGQRAGIVSHVKVDINFSDSEKYWSAWVVVGCRSGSREGPFMFGGDSGTWVLDTAGNLQGYGFGGDDETGTGFVVSAKEMYEDITTKTGLEIIDPKLN